jgi:hypothetical protein
LGGLTCLRGHLSDSLYYLRKAIELCAFAALIKRDPSLAQIWFDAVDDDESYKIYRSEFTQKGLYPNDHILLSLLYERFDFCSKIIHSSTYSIARRFKMEQTEAQITLSLNYFELKNGDRSEPITTLLYILDTHFIILRVFEEVFPEVISQDPIK